MADKVALRGFTVLDLELLTFFHGKKGGVETLKYPDTAVRDSLSVLTTLDLLEKVEPPHVKGPVYKVTDRGDVWLKQTLKTPLPIRKDAWINPDNQEVLGWAK